MRNEKPEIKPLQPDAPRSLIMVVDDEEHNRILLCDSLEARGYELIEADNGLIALGKIAVRPPDVILLDAMMPKMDGFEVCRRLKGNPATASIPILMVTALSDRKERLMGIEAGANDFLTKPVDVQDLVLRVANAAFTKQLFDQLEFEKQKSDRLLLNILPKSISDRMKKGEVSIADNHEDVTVLLADLVGFTTLASHVRPEQLVSLLDEIFSSFDALVEKYDLEKIKTIGDAYMVAAGIPQGRSDHAEVMGVFALEMMKELERFNLDYDTAIRIRIGIATGPVIAGVIGQMKFAYDLWGETVNTACHLEALAQPGSIQVSETTFNLLRDKFEFGPAHTIHPKGGSNIVTCELQGHTGAFQHLPEIEKMAG
ncbi:MAG: adenylate/guanylate cyclase domain-containing protein [Verrucomicrobiota bacterium]